MARRVSAQARVKAAPQRVDGAYIRQLVAAVDKAIAAQPVPYDMHDTPRDRLFAIVMQRIDALQEKRTEYLAVIAAIQRQPSLLPVLGNALYASFTKALTAAALLHKPWHVAALLGVYTATVSTWRNDTTADLAKTMKVCDTSLGLLENAVAFIEGRRAA